MKVCYSSQGTYAGSSSGIPDLKTSLSIFARTQASQLRFWL